MTNMDNLMRNASEEQRVILGNLQGFVAQEKKLIEETKKSWNKENYRRYIYPTLDGDCESPMDDKGAEEYLKTYSVVTKKRLEEIQGKIKKAVQDAKSKGILVVDYNSLR